MFCCCCWVVFVCLFVCFGTNISAGVHGGPSVSRMTLSVPLICGTGVALQADPGLAEPCAVWALEVLICRWDTGCQVVAFSGQTVLDGDALPLAQMTQIVKVCASSVCAEQ